MIMLSSASCASAGRSISTKQSAETQIPEFLFYEVEDGLKCGVCPVYTAPSVDSFRCDDGEAICITDNSLYIGGFNAERWLLVRYSTNDGNTRVGYIPPSYVQNYSSSKTLDFSFVETTADTSLYVTDNPLNNYSAYAVLDPDETYYILGDYKYHGDWWYIECTVDGKVARGFIEK